jgi:hypothetical protein
VGRHRVFCANAAAPNADEGGDGDDESCEISISLAISWQQRNTSVKKMSSKKQRKPSNNILHFFHSQAFALISSLLISVDHHLIDKLNVLILEVSRQR